MKKKISALLATLIFGTMLVGCGSANKDSGNANVTTESIVQTVKDNIEMRMTAKVEDDLLGDLFYLNMDDVEEQTIEKGQINTGLETIAVVKAKEGKAESVKASFEKYLENLKSIALYPGEPEAVESAKLEVIGNYVGLFVIPNYEEGENNNSQKALELFEKALK